jgi:poly(hydroxyalkanoate) granule-associated protein
MVEHHATIGWAIRMTQHKSRHYHTPHPTWGPVLDAARQLWLAGLGVAARARQEGSRLFADLVEEGAQLETRTRQAAEDSLVTVKHRVDDQIEDVKDRAGNTWDGLEQVFEERVSRALNRLDVPTSEDVQELTKRLQALNVAVKQLLDR